MVRILNHFNVHEGIDVTYQEILNLERGAKEFDQLIKNPENAYVSIALDEDRLDKNLGSIYIQPFFIKIGGLFLAELVSLKGECFFEGSKLVMKSPKFVREKQFVVSVDDNFDAVKTKNDISDYMFKISEKYERDYNVICSEF